jgi:hypothetical protein
VDDPVAVLAREARGLVERLRLWTPARFAAAGPPPFATRADVVHHLAQALADRAAELEGEPRRPLPRLDDLALPDQLAVTADDLVRAAPPPRTAVAAACHLLLHRAELLGEEVPAGLAYSLDTPSIQAAAAVECDETGTSAL